MHRSSTVHRERVYRHFGKELRKKIEKVQRESGGRKCFKRHSAQKLFWNVISFVSTSCS
jgi:hypothetical protein